MEEEDDCVTDMTVVLPFESVVVVSLTFPFGLLDVELLELVVTPEVGELVLWVPEGLLEGDIEDVGAAVEGVEEATVVVKDDWLVTESEGEVD